MMNDGLFPAINLNFIFKYSTTQLSKITHHKQDTVSALYNSSYSFQKFYVFKQYKAIPTFLTADLVKFVTKAKITAMH